MKMNHKSDTGGAKTGPGEANTGPLTQPVNIWRREGRPVDENPYPSNAFQVARLPRRITARKQVVQVITSTRRIIQTDPDRHQIEGSPVSLADLNTAEAILLDPTRRILEELLEHAEERPALEHLQVLAQEVENNLEMQGPLIVDPGYLSRPGSREILQGWARQLLRQALEAEIQPDPSFGALETALVPPFGWQEED
jgi:hypothetical protein